MKKNMHLTEYQRKERQKLGFHVVREWKNNEIPIFKKEKTTGVLLCFVCGFLNEKKIIICKLCRNCQYCGGYNRGESLGFCYNCGAYNNYKEKTITNIMKFKV